MPAYSYPTKRGPRWQYVVHHEGIPYRRRGYLTRAEALQAGTIRLADVMRGQSSKAPARLTLGDYLTRHWLPTKEPALKPQSRSVYHRALEVMTPLHAKRLDKLTALDLQAWVRSMQADYSPKTLGDYFRVTKQALRQAVRWDLIPRNPAEAVILPRVQQREPRFLTVPQLQGLLAAADVSPQGAIVHLALLTGLRKGELLALLWADVDLEAGILRVQAGKTPDARRGVALGQQALEALHRQRVQQTEWRLAAGPAWGGGAYVFSSLEGHRMRPGKLQNYWLLIRARAGLSGMRFHDLRHAHATLLALAGVPPRIAQARLGHSNPMFTMRIYQHIAPTDQVDAAASVERLLRGNS